MSNGTLHVIFGTGPVGLAVAAALLANEERVRLVSRSGKTIPPPGAELRRGDATDPASARALCVGATHVYNCTNPPDYHRWPEQFPPLQHGVLAGAAAHDARLIVMENLYMYGPHDGAPLTEETPLRGHGSRSTTRRQMTEELFRLHAAGVVRVTTGRASDLFGPRVGESLAGERLFGPALAGKAVQLFADADLPHSLTYIRDVGRALVTLGAHDEALGRAWHLPNAPAVTPREFIARVGATAGTTPSVVPMSRRIASALLPLLGAVTPSLRGIRENLYQVYEPYIVDSGAYERTFGESATPMTTAIEETVAWHRAQRGRGTAH